MPVKPRSPSRKKIGEYLPLKNKSVDEALELQRELRDRDIVKLFGEILIETGRVTGEELERALDRQKLDIMKLLPVFRTIPVRDLKVLSSMMEDIFVGEDEEFIAQDSLGDYLYILLTGTARGWMKLPAGSIWV